MKKIILALCLLVVFSVKAQDEVNKNTETTTEIVDFEQVFEQEEVQPVVGLNWVENFSDAVAKSKEENKLIVILFEGSDWCKPCKILEKEVFNSERFKNYADKFVFYKADFPRNRDLVSDENKQYNADLQQKYNQESFPTIIIIDKKGELKARKEGYYMSDAYFTFFEEFVK